MTIRNKKISQVRFDKTNVDAPTINRALDNVINPLNSWIDDATQAINNLETNAGSGGGTITINPENAASITANNITLNGAGGITYASNGSDTITIYQQPISVAANGTAGTGTGNSITINGSSGITATRSGTTINLAGSPSAITLNADTGSITGDVFNIIAEGCCIHTETSGSDTLIISSSAPCEFTNGDGNIDITIPSNTTISGSQPNTILLAHLDTNLVFGGFASPDTGQAGTEHPYPAVGWLGAGATGLDTTTWKFGSGSANTNGASNGFIYCRLDATSGITSSLGQPYLQNVDGTSGDFTLECWIYPVVTTGYGFQNLMGITKYGATAATWGFGLYIYLGQLAWCDPANPAGVGTGYTFTTPNQWYAVAVSRSGNTTRVYVNGALVYTTTGADFKTDNDFVIAGQSPYGAYVHPLQGNIDEIRYSNVAHYTGSSYTPASAAFPNFSGVPVTTTDYCERQFDFADNLVISASITSPIVSGSQGRFSQMTSSAYTGSTATIGSVTSNTFTGGTYTGSLATITSITASSISASSNIIAPAITGSEISSSNFIGWGNKIVRPYGAFCDLTTQTASVANTAYPMLLGTTEEAIGVSIVSGSQITFAHAGTYNIQFSAQIGKSSGGSAETYIWLSETGSNVARSNTNVHIRGNNINEVAAWNWVRTFPSGSYAEIYWTTDDTDVELIYENSSSSPTKPEVPSVILSVSQV